MALQARAQAVAKLSTRLFVWSGVGTALTLASAAIDIRQYQLDNAIAAAVATSGDAAAINARVQDLQARARAFNSFRGLP